MISTNGPNSTNAPGSGWFKASFSDNAASCVEVRFADDLVLIRDSKYRRSPANDLAHEPVITVTPDQWAEFLDEVTGRAKAGIGKALSVELELAGIAVLRAAQTGTTLTFTEAEWQAFRSGAEAREFDHPASATIT